MVRGFGLLLVLGIGLGVGVRASAAGFAALSRFARRRPDAAGAFPAARRRADAAALWAAAARSGSPTTPGARSALALERPRRVLAIGLALAVVGLALDTQSEVVSDVRELVPQDLQALKDVNALQEETGVSGEIDVTVRADDITDPAVVAWMTRFQDARPAGARLPPGQALRAGDEDRRELCPALSLPDLFSTAGEQQSARCASCSTPSRRTSRRAWSRATAGPPTSPSASG